MPKDFDAYITEQTHTITLVGPMEERETVLSHFSSLGFRRIVRSGPYTDWDLWPKHDVKRFLAVLEKVE